MLPAWQAELADSFTNPLELLSFLELDPSDIPGLSDASARFPFRVTRPYATRIRKGDPDDALLRQVLPIADELIEQPGFGADPVGDLLSVATPGLLHKYEGRVLLISTGACAIHCRYCFRQEFPYDANLLSKRREQEVLTHMASEHSIREVILSGGDPLVFSDERLSLLIEAIAAIPHVTRLRIHTRLPLALPNRVTQELTSLLAKSRLRSVVVIHANHPNELNDEVKQAMKRLGEAGITLLNQSVLLKGVNDDADLLSQLSERLFECGVLPYYLHMLDRARGAAHFEVTDERARDLLETLRRRLPGYLVPRLVRENAGEPYKTPLG